jgi:exonuclease SbcD
MSEAGQQKYAVLLEAEAGEPVSYTSLPLKSGLDLCRKRFFSVEEAVCWLKENPDSIVELTMETEEYLKPEERRQLAQAHSRIIGPIPIVKNANPENEDQDDVIELDQDIRVLFKNYFRSRHNQSPNSDIISLFDEVISLVDE